VGLRRTSLEALADHVRGRGVVARGGYLAYHWGEHTRPGDLASARKPIISALLLYGVQEGLVPSPDATLDRYLPGLREINRGKDAAITWKHLASQTSGYGWSEQPGEAWSYNDFALALYVDTLFDRALQRAPPMRFTAGSRARCGLRTTPTSMPRPSRACGAAGESPCPRATRRASVSSTCAAAGGTASSSCAAT
jgi:CubicO group peptidase (beta-lactamase class C family)